jgi:hypothetical protein
VKSTTIVPANAEPGTKQSAQQAQNKRAYIVDPRTGKRSGPRGSLPNRLPRPA